MTSKLNKMKNIQTIVDLFYSNVIINNDYSNYVKNIDRVYKCKIKFQGKDVIKYKLKTKELLDELKD